MENKLFIEKMDSFTTVHWVLCEESPISHVRDIMSLLLNMIQFNVDIGLFFSETSIFELRKLGFQQKSHGSNRMITIKYSAK